MPRKTLRDNSHNTPVNLFTGNIYELVERLEDIPEEIEAYYLKFATQPDKKTAIERILAGDAETFERYQAQTKNVKFAGFNSKELIFDNEGLFFDTATYLTGQPEYWINETDTTTAAPAKDIKINISAPHWTEEKDIFNKLIKIVELIDQAEANGQRLTIKAICHSFDYRDKTGEPFKVEIEIKKDSEPINIQQLVYLIANPILLRYAILSMQKAHGLNYNPVAYQPVEENNIKDDSFIYIPSITYDFLNGICYTGSKKFNYENLNLSEQYKINF